MFNDMLDPKTDILEISNEELLREFNTSNKYTKMNLYALMSTRANINSEIKSKLFEQILNMDARREVVSGRIMHSWFPAIYILKHGNDNLKLDLKEVLKQWTKEEKRNFLDYIKSEQEYFCLLYDIVN